MPTVAFPLEISASAEDSFEAVALVYGEAEGDLIEPGAFTKTLSAAAERPLLYRNRPVGTVTLEDTPEGLKLTGHLEAKVPLEDKRLSIGFEVKREINGPVRRIQEVRVWELTLSDNGAAMDETAAEVSAAIGEWKNAVLDSLKGKNV